MVGMDFGEWVYERSLDIIVNDVCLSSCANYVFTAGRRKLILPGGFVAWHGNAHLSSLEDKISALPEEVQTDAQVRMRTWRAREDAFYRRIGVSECLARIGNEQLGVRGLFTMSPHDMSRFGVKNVDGAPTAKERVSERIRDRVDFEYVTIPVDAGTFVVCS
jgi:hypothetical protein